MTGPRPTTLVLLACSLFFVGRAAAQEPAIIDRISHFQVVGAGQDEGGDFCSDFALTPSQADWFFSRAKALDAQALHDRFDLLPLLPCWVRGTAESADGTWHWEIRAGGTARMVSPGGLVKLFGCDDCDAVLSGTAASPAR